MESPTTGRFLPCLSLGHLLNAEVDTTFQAGGGRWLEAVPESFIEAMTIDQASTTAVIALLPVGGWEDAVAPGVSTGSEPRVHRLTESHYHFE